MVPVSGFRSSVVNLAFIFDSNGRSRAAMAETTKLSVEKALEKLRGSETRHD